MIASVVSLPRRNAPRLQHPQRSKQPNLGTRSSSMASDHMLLTRLSMEQFINFIRSARTPATGTRQRRSYIPPKNGFSSYSFMCLTLAPMDTRLFVLAPTAALMYMLTSSKSAAAIN